MVTHLSDWPVEELPCVRVDMSLLLIMAGQFCPGYSSSIFSQATPYFSISISSPVQALSANLLQTFSQTRERGAEKMRGRESRDEELLGPSLQSCFLFPKGVGNADSGRGKKKVCHKMMLWLRSLSYVLHVRWHRTASCINSVSCVCVCVYVCVLYLKSL